MNRRPASLKKITVPALGKIVSRRRLFGLLDRPGPSSVTWISGMAGSGKTTLAASFLRSRDLRCLWYQLDERDADLATFFYYLGSAVRRATPRKRKKLPLFTSEYVRGASTFARRYFEAMGDRLGAPFCLVFDDYHTIPASAPFHAVFRDGLASLSPDLHVLVLSRTDPPPVFAAMAAQNALRIVGRQDLRLTVHESAQLLRAAFRGPVRRERVERIHRRTEGWAAGLVLMARSMAREEPLPDDLDSLTPADIFDYFAGELFDGLEERLKDFLLRTAFLPRITGPMAAALTGRRRAGRKLASLARSHLFIEKQDSSLSVYQYHPLFRQFLLARAETVLDAGEIAALRQQAARVAEEAGYLEDAVDLCAAAGRTVALVRLIEQQAPALIEQGRNETLVQWIRRIPDDAMPQYPRMHYWLGVCCQHACPVEARAAFERAFRLFEARQDIAGLLRCWSGIVESTVYEWNDFTVLDPWIAWLGGRIEEGLTYPSPEIEAPVAVSMMCALMFRGPDRADMAEWVERALLLARQHGDMRLRMEAWDWAITYYCWLGNFARADILKEESRQWMQAYLTDPAVKLHLAWVEIAARVFNGVPGPSDLEEITAALRLAEDTGIHVWDHMFLNEGIYIALMLGELSKAADFLERVRRSLSSCRRHAYSVYHHSMGLYHLLDGDPARALEHARTASQIADETGHAFPSVICRYGLAQILVEQGAFAEAGKELDFVYEMSVRTGSKMLEFMSLAARARLALKQGRDEQGESLLCEALGLGRQRHFRNMIWWWQPELTADLLPRALAAEIETEYTRDLLRSHRVVVSPPPYHIAVWPWAFRIRTLGGFEILRDDRPIQAAGRAYRKPLDLLKVLIACGGREVSVGRITDALWTEADGDMARSAFSTTLNRLRTFLAEKDLFVLRAGKLSLNDEICWVDTRAFGDVLGRADVLWRGGRTDAAIAMYETALTHYRGPLLAEDGESRWVVAPRARFHSLFVEAVMKLGRHRENESDFEGALAWYQRGLDVDPTHEGFYQRSMMCCGRLGRHVEVEKTFRHCTQILRSTLDVDPSPQTVRAYEEAHRT
ncbi:MAG: hypothetical protein JW741_25605 [Sedimentisphaerales bacterium]|nr:hypothetical protein [Sedimentisphaerales bacterium]